MDYSGRPDSEGEVMGAWDVVATKPLKDTGADPWAVVSNEPAGQANEWDVVSDAPADQQHSFMDQIGGGIDSLQSSFQKTGALIADKVGDPDLAKGMRIAAGENDVEAGKVQYQSKHGDSGWKQALNLSDPEWWKATIAESLPGSAPFLAGAVAGAAATPIPHPIAKLIGAGLGGGAAVVLQEVGPAYQDFKKVHPDDEEGAIDYAIKKAGLTGVVNAASIGLGPIGYGSGAIKHALIQMAIQPSVGVADTVSGNAMEQANIDPNTPLSRGVAKSAVGEIAVDAPGTVGIVRHVMNGNTEQPAQNSPEMTKQVTGESGAEDAAAMATDARQSEIAQHDTNAMDKANQYIATVDQAREQGMQITPEVEQQYNEMKGFIQEPDGSTSSGGWDVIKEEPASNTADEAIAAGIRPDQGMNTAEIDQIAPKVPEPATTIQAQMEAFTEGRKPAVLITPGEQMPAIPDGAKAFELEGSGTLIYKDNQTLAKALNPETLGEALGYGTGAKPESPTGAVVSKDAAGRIVAEQVTDNTDPAVHQPVMAAAENLAGEGGTVEAQQIEQVLQQRQQSTEQGVQAVEESVPGGEAKLSGIIEGQSASAEEEVSAAIARAPEGNQSQVMATDAEPPKLSDPQVVEDTRKAPGPIEQGQGQAKEAGPVVAGTPMPADSIGSFGEKLEGSKRDKYQRMRDAVADDDIASVPLSKAWPKQDLSKVEDNYVAAFIQAARDEIPAKPRVAHKVQQWSKKVAMMRRFADDLMAGDVNINQMKEMVADNRTLREFNTKLDLLTKIDRSLWGSVKKVQDWSNAYTFKDDGNGGRVKVNQPTISVNHKSYPYKASWTEAVDQIAADLGGVAAEPAKTMQFEVRGSAGRFSINKKGDPEYRKLKDSFADSKTAFEFIRTNRADLEHVWEGVKARDNVGKTDMRNKANRERAGADHRDGKDATEDMFNKALGFRGVDFGNWVKQGGKANERQQMLNDAYDALIDLSTVMKIPSRALSLNGELGLAFGARGSGFASAHFESSNTDVSPSTFIINLTKTRGAGALAHEWFHALDNYFQRQRGTSSGREGHYVTYRPEPMMVFHNGRVKPLTREQLNERQRKYPNAGIYSEQNWKVDPNHPQGIREEVEAAFAELVNALDQSPMKGRSLTIDKNKSDGYWSRVIERAARSFENYVINEMALNGIENDYLANVKAWDQWQKNPERYPYLKPDEIAPIKDAFDNLFQTLETKETEKGLALFSRTGKESSGVSISPEKLDPIIERVALRVGNRWPVHTAHAFADLPVSIKEQADKQGSDGSDIDGVFHRGEVYLIRENLARHRIPEARIEEALLHEFAHGDIRAMFGKDMALKLNTLFLAAGGHKGIKAIADKHGINLKPYARSGMQAGMSVTERQNLIMDEILAHLAQEKPNAARRVKEVIGMIRQWLRDHGFAKLAEYGETDLLNVLRQARKAMATATDDRATFMISNHGQDGQNKPAEGDQASRSGFELQPQTNGSLIVAGHGVRSALKDAGIGFAPRNDGTAYVSKKNAEKARKALGTEGDGAGGFDGFVGEQQKAAKSLSWDGIKGYAKDKRRVLMGILTNLQLVEVYSPAFRGMAGGNPLTQYATNLQKLEAERNGALHEAELIDQEWDKLSNQESESMAKVMNDATMYGIHPDQPFESFMAELEEKLTKVKSEEESAAVGREISNERQREQMYPSLQKRYRELSKEGKAIYRDVRDLYTEQWNKTRDELIERVARNIPDEALRKKSMSEIRLAFMKAIHIGPYFPLSRFGDFVTIARKGDDYIRDHFETSVRQKQAAEKYRKAGFTVSELKGEEFSQGDIGNAPDFAKDVFALLDKYGMQSTDLADDLNQLVLQKMPDMSALKHSVHRKRIKGYSGDARRAFAHTIFHGAHHLSRIMYADRMQNEINRIKEEVKLLQGGKESTIEDGNLAVDVLNEMKARHEKIMNPNSHPLTSYLGSLGFIWYLGASPAAGIVNMTQTPLVTLPMLAGKHGWAKSSAALMKAAKDYARAPFKAGTYEAWMSLDRSKLLPMSERLLMDELIKDGTMDITQAHALAQLAETDTRHNAKGEMSRSRAKAMRYVGAFFHNAEVANRQISALAAYRLERASGADHQQAVDHARKVVFDSHFNYTSSNRPRYMKGDVVRVVTMFKQYSQHMTYALLRNFNQSFKGESPEVRKQARKTLAGILAMHATMAGTIGLPLASVIFSALDLAFDDDDEPYDSRTAYRNWLADTFGTTAGEAIAKGAGNAFTPMDIHSRVSLDELWLRTPDRDLRGKDEAMYYLEQASGPIGALFLNIWSGAGSIAEGHVERGFEKMVPKFVRDFARAARYHEEGIKTYRGDPIIEDTTPAEEAAQAMGFAPARAGERYEARNTVKNMQSGIGNRREQLLNWYAESIRDNDSIKQSDVVNKIQRFNEKNPAKMIDAKVLKHSLKTRARISGQTEHGIYLPKGSKHLIEAGRFAE